MAPCSPAVRNPPLQGAPHRPVRDARVRELRSVRLVSQPLVEAQRVRLRVQVHRRQPTRACRVLHGPHQRRPDAQPAGLTGDGEPPPPPPPPPAPPPPAPRPPGAPRPPPRPPPAPPPPVFPAAASPYSSRPVPSGTPSSRTASTWTATAS